MDLKSKIILISGPTASGKSSFAIKIAKKVNGEIINADSIQVYKKLKILTARPGKEDLKKVKHNLYGFVDINKKAINSRNYTQCDSLLGGNQSGAHTVPYIDSKNNTAVIEHEASTSKINEDQLYYCRQRGLSHEEAVSLIVNGFCKQVLQELPMEFAVEAQKLVSISLEGSVG